jgi:hypothetical protein
MNSMLADGVDGLHHGSCLGWAFPREDAGSMLGVVPERYAPRYLIIVCQFPWQAWIPLKLFSKKQRSSSPVA